MIRSPFDSDTVRALQIALGGLMKRQTTIAHNIANADTPMFEAREVVFEEALRRAARPSGEPVSLVRTNDRHLSLYDGAPTLNHAADAFASAMPTKETARRNDGNNVNLERELALMGETGVRFNAVAQVLANRYQGLRNIIADGRR
ncbi:MAG: flagellar basal body rod protein FlgB [Dehalococcoidia bacterium]|nr:flagellar basal body rod protein FlgB [Dehalococcoidia bacterium]